MVVPITWIGGTDPLNRGYRSFEVVVPITWIGGTDPLNRGYQSFELVVLTLWIGSTNPVNGFWPLLLTGVTNHREKDKDAIRFRLPGPHKWSSSKTRHKVINHLRPQGKEINPEIDSPTCVSNDTWSVAQCPKSLPCSVSPLSAKVYYCCRLNSHRDV